MSQRQRDYDSTVARIAGNILSGNPNLFMDNEDDRRVARKAVWLARIIIAETKLTEPITEQGPHP